MREQGEHSGENRALPSHQCCPGSNPGIDAVYGLSLLLVISLVLRGLSLCILSPPPPSSKTNTSKFQLHLECRDTREYVVKNS